MAEIRLFQVQFLKDNPFGYFVTGDLLDVYAETDDVIDTGFSSIDGIYVNKNGVLYTDNTYSIKTDRGFVQIQNFNPKICKNTSLLTFLIRSDYPFAYYIIAENSYSCAVSPLVCDLKVIGVPFVTLATDSVTADGQIAINTTSRNAEQYKIGSDFVYGDGTGQDSGTFSGLLPGKYTVYVRDTANCGVSVLVDVGISTTYGPFNRMEYDDYRGDTTRIDITKKNYSGSVTEVIGSGIPFKIDLRGEGSDDKFTSLIGVTAVVEFVAEVDGYFEDIYSNDPNLFRINYYKDTGSGFDQKNTFKILPQLFQAQYKAPPYYVNFSATDGLSELKNNYLIQSDGRPYFGTIKLIKLVSHCLSFLKLDLNILVACNLYAVESEDPENVSIGMDITDSDDPLDQGYVDFDLFYLQTDKPSLEFVLQTILDAFGARIVQADNRWCIVRVEEMVDSFDYRLFDQYGDYDSNSTYSPVVDIVYPTDSGDAILTNADHTTIIKNGYGLVRAIYNLGLKPNILRNGDFRLKTEYIQGVKTYVIDKEGWTFVNSTYPIYEDYLPVGAFDDVNVAYQLTVYSEYFTTDIGKAYILSDEYTVKMGANDKLQFSITCRVDTFRVNYIYTKIRVQITYGSLYLNSDGTWSSDANILSFFMSEYHTFQTFKLEANMPDTGTPTDGMSLNVKVFHAHPHFSEFNTISDLQAMVTYLTVPTGFRTELREGILIFDNPIYYYELQNNTDTPSGYDIIQPDDYDVVLNPRQWILVSTMGVYAGTYKFSIDSIKLTFLQNGVSPFDKIIRSNNAENNNNLLYEKEFNIGSSSSLIVTEIINRPFHPEFPNDPLDLIHFNEDVFKTFVLGYELVSAIVSSLSSDLIYAGYIRNSSGVGYEFWKRDGVSEEDKLHGIMLKSYAAQYKRSFRVLSGSFYALNYFGFLNVLRETNDDNRLYLPMSLSLDDKRCMYSGELYELSNIFEGVGSDGTSEAPYTSGFSVDFGRAFN